MSKNIRKVDQLAHLPLRKVLDDVFGSFTVDQLLATVRPVFTPGAKSADLRNRRLDGVAEQDHRAAQDSLGETIGHAVRYSVGVKIQTPYGPVFASLYSQSDSPYSQSDYVPFSWHEICELYGKKDLIKLIFDMKLMLDATILTSGTSAKIVPLHERIRVRQESVIKKGGWDV